MSEEDNCLSVKQAQILCLQQNIPFYSYRMPGEQKSYFGAQLKECPEHFNRFAALNKQSGFIISPFNATGKLPALFIRGDLTFSHILTAPESIRQIQSIHHSVTPVLPQGVDTTPEEYSEQATGLITALKQGKALKVVLSRTITRTYPSFKKAAALFEKMTKRYPDAFVFLVSIPGVTTWIGASPEMFLSKTSSSIRTMSLAGTQPADQKGTCAEWDYKDREEQQIVSDYIQHVLQPACPNKLIINGPYPHRAGNVYHLCTTFECMVPGDFQEADILREQLHPTPAVGGFPKAEALTLLRHTEKHDRRYYAGHLGPVNRDGTFDLFVNLRSMELFADMFRIYVGGGITALSDPIKEWQETEIKSRTMLNLIEDEK